MEKKSINLVYTVEFKFKHGDKVVNLHKEQGFVETMARDRFENKYWISYKDPGRNRWETESSLALYASKSAGFLKDVK